jgi:hypothetical protein
MLIGKVCIPNKLEIIRRSASGSSMFASRQKTKAYSSLPH